jgi:hypothetical protein
MNHRSGWRNICRLHMLAILVNCAACATGRPNADLATLVSPLDAGYIVTSTAPVVANADRTTGLTTVYRGGIARVLASDCEMLPSDSRHYDAIHQNCGPISALYRTSARLLLEVEANFDVLPATMNRGKIRWMDPPYTCNRAARLQVDGPLNATTTPVDTCNPELALRCQSLVLRVRSLLRAHRAFEAHITATTGTVVCDCASQRLQFWDAMALRSLDDAQLAVTTWRSLLTASPPVATDARLALAWSLFESRDTSAAVAVSQSLPVDLGNRLATWRDHRDSIAFASGIAKLPNAAMQREAVRLQAAHQMASEQKRPWLAGALSAVLPGAGQLYAGSIQGAAMSFVLNSVLIATTIEFARRDLYFAAGTSGLVASVFYVGGIFNASDLAARRNRRASAAIENRLVQTLLPELSP